jgi:hypothetical protein
MKPFQAKVILLNYMYGTLIVNTDTLHVKLYNVHAAMQIHLLKFI